VAVGREIARHCHTVRVKVEPVSPTAPRRVAVAAMRQDWRDVVFLHWEVSTEDARRYLPAGVEPDRFEGRTFVGLIGLRIRVAVLAAVPVPYLGEFPEVNVRLYSVDRAGRRGIVFCSLDAGRLVPTLLARTGYRLPYMWWAGAAIRAGDEMAYAGRRRWPDGHPSTRFAVRVGEPLTHPTTFEHFLTARWALHWSWLGRTVWSAAAHQTWPLHRAELLACADELIAAAGLPAPTAQPVSVLWSPGVSARIGPPQPL
jgi:uncharacterized protein